MSLNAKQAHSFLGPLHGKVVTFLVSNRDANLSLVRGISALSAAVAYNCTILDVDAFCSSHSDEIFSGLPQSVIKKTHIIVPEPGSSIETEILLLLRRGNSNFFVIESLNTLYHLFGSSGASSKSRRLSFILFTLSYLTKTSNKMGFLIMYDQERLTRSSRNRSISDFADITLSVQVIGSKLMMECLRGLTWPSGRFALTFP